jgi:hypothetical protein
VTRQREADFPTCKGEQRKTTTAKSKISQMVARVVDFVFPVGRQMAFAA